MARPASLPWVLAASSCSTRRGTPNSASGKRATSPAAYTSGWLVCSRSFTRMPFSTASPPSSASSLFCWIPTPPAPPPGPPRRSPLGGLETEAGFLAGETGHQFARDHLDPLLAEALVQEAG